MVERLRHELFELKKKARAQSALMKAIDDSLSHWEGLTLFLSDVIVPLTNNDTERTIRYAVRGRKKFYGSRTHNGADVIVRLYTIIESCKKMQLDSASYINMAVHMSAREDEVPTPLEYARQTRTA